MGLDVLCLRPEADFVRAGASAPAGLRVAYRALQDGDVPELLKLARALVIPAVGEPISEKLFEDTAIQFVQVTGAGVDRVDAASLANRGIAVANVPAGSNHAVAEYVVGTAIVLLRRMVWADSEIRAGNYAAFRKRMMADSLPGLQGLVAGVVGLGTIGLAVAGALRKAGCEICYSDPFLRDRSNATALGAPAMALPELLRTSDIISLHVPLLEATRKLIGRQELSQMKPTAVLIQAARGGIVDEVALAETLCSGHLAGAAVDVYQDEPPAADHPLLGLEGEAARKVLFTPHIAGVTRQSAKYLMTAAWQNVERVLLRGEAPWYRAN